MLLDYLLCFLSLPHNSQHPLFSSAHPFRYSSTYRATSDSCCLVRFRGWLKAVIPYWLGFSPFCRLARRMALLITFRKELMACQPLLLNHTWNKTHQVQGTVPNHAPRSACTQNMHAKFREKFQSYPKRKHCSQRMWQRNNSMVEALTATMWPSTLLRTSRL